MIAQYIRWTLRGLWTHRFTALVNLFALSLGMISFVLACGAALFLRSSDAQLPNAERIYAVTQQAVDPQSGFSTGVLPMSSVPVAKYLLADCPEVEAATRLRTASMHGTVLNGQAHFLKILYADKSFVRIFRLPFLLGDSESALTRPNSAVLAEKTARDLFGEQNPLGKVLTFGGVDVTVTGVAKEISQPSQFAVFPNVFEILLSDDVGEILDPPMAEPDVWQNISVSTFFLLPEGVSLARVSQALTSFGDRHVHLGTQSMRFGAAPLIGSQEALLNALIRTDRTGLSVVVLLLAMGSLVLVVAALNYANLAAAQAAGRLRESGMRILLGARKGQIILQILVESALMAAFALLLVLVLLAFLTPLLARETGIDLGALLFHRAAFWALLVGGIAVTAAIGALSPSLLLSGNQAVAAARGGKTRQGASKLANFFVGLQFLAASLLLIMVIVMSLQNVKLRDLVSPADSDSLLVITTPLDGLPFKIRDVRTALRDIPQVLAVTAADSQPWTMDIHAATLFPAKDPGSRRVDGYFNLVAEDYIEGIGARLLAGRDFSVARGGDLMPMSLRGVDASFNVIVDRSLALAFGWSPDEAVGREIFRRTNSVPAPFRIIGVIEDRPQHFLGLGSQGNLYGFSPEATSFPVIRLAKGAGSAGLQAIDRALTALAPQTPLQRRFSSDLFDENSDVFLVVAASFGGLAVFAVMIALLGLSGMAVHVTNRRTQEIGIRKILGASYGAVLRLLLWDLSRPVLVAGLLAWPIAYVGAEAYLSLFTQRASLGIAPFLISLAATLSVALAAVGWRIAAAARRNPADILRYE